MSEQSKTYCVLPFMGAHADVKGDLSPCCKYETIQRDYGLKKLRDFQQWWDFDLEPLRQDMLNGRQNKNCHRCWKDEANGIDSHRIINNRIFKHHLGLTKPLPKPVFWIMGIGNYCNLRCIMCSPFQSTSYAQEFEKHRGKFNKIGMNYVNYARGNWADEDLDALHTIAQGFKEQIHFSGGEPLMTSDYKRFLGYIENPSEVELVINTNLTRLDQEWIELFKKFKTSIQVSLEGAGAHNDYIRYGSDWNVIEKNIQLLRGHGIEVRVVHAFGRISLISLPPLIDYCQDNQLKMAFASLRFPEFLSITSAPRSEREYFKNKFKNKDGRYFDNLSNLLGCLEALDKEPYNPDLDREFWKYIDLQDELNGTDFQKTFLHETI